MDVVSDQRMGLSMLVEGYVSNTRKTVIFTEITILLPKSIPHNLITSFCETPLLYIRNPEEKSDLCCPNCGKSLS